MLRSASLHEVCEKFIRATSIPARIILRKTPDFAEAGPKVQMILVLGIIRSLYGVSLRNRATKPIYEETALYE